MSYKLLLTLSLAVFLIPGIGVDLYAPSLPAITNYFNSSNAVVKLTITTYLLGFSIGQFLFGTLADIYGRRIILLIGLALFFAASIAAAYSPSIEVLLLLRAVQGLAAASPSAVAKTLLTDTLSGKKLNIGMTYLAITWGTGPIIAPIIGGYLQFYFSWHANFHAYAIYSGIVLIATLFLLKETIQQRAQPNVREIILTYRKIYAHKIFIGAAASMGLGYSTIILFSIFGPFIVQSELGYSSVFYGYIALFVGSAFFVGGMINRLLIHLINVHIAMKMGLSIMLFASLVMIYFAFRVPMGLLPLTLPIFVAVIGIGITFPNCLSMSLDLFRHISGMAGAALAATTFLITMVTTSIISLFETPHFQTIACSIFAMAALQALAYFFFLEDHKINAE